MSRRFFFIGLAFEGGIGLAALLANRLLARPALGNLHWSLAHLLIGMLAALPLLGLMYATLRSSWAPLYRLRTYVLTTIYPLFKDWTPLQLLLLSALAGFGEELAFRGVLQELLARWLGPIPALAVASALFGLCHALTPSYAILATFMGVCLGWLWLFTENLLTPMICHSLYDFLALTLLLRLGHPPLQDPPS